MRALGEYTIQFEGLKQGIHLFEFEVDNQFFEEFECFDFEQASFKVEVQLEKRSTMMLLNFKFNGGFKVPCDRCLDEVEIEVSGDENLIVKFGEDSYEQTDEIIIIQPHEHEINVAASIYEFILVNAPQKRVHQAGECNAEVLKKLKVVEQKEENNEIDPRWATLKDINKEK